MPVTVKRRVQRSQMWARIFLHGPSGAGKTRGAFEIASRLFDGNLKIALANTEANRGELYADRFNIEALIEIEGDYHPQRFIEAIDIAEKEVPGGILIIDSATHEWYGTNGVTQLANKFSDWNRARPLHQTFVDRLQVANLHLIVCCRSKMKYEQVEIERPNGTKQQTVIALGIGPMQDADFQYEFSLAGQFDRTTHDVEWSGHVDALEGTTTNLVTDGDTTIAAIERWLSEGTPIEPIEIADEAEVAKLRAALDAEGFEMERIDAGFAVARRENRGQLHPDYVAEQLKKAEGRLKAKAAPEPEPEPAAA